MAYPIFLASAIGVGVARNLCWGLDNRGAEIETPKASRGVVWGVPLSSRLRGLGERRKLPQAPAGSGAEPRPKTSFCFSLEHEKSHLIAAMSF